MDNKSILNIENYKTTFMDKNTEIHTQFIILINKYNSIILESISILKHDYFKYIYLKGIESLTYIFNILMFYTKNLPLTCYHCEKSLFYYIEFIGQIGDDNHTFLQLNSKDAILFIYKKTIFDIDDTYKKNMELSSKDSSVVECLNTFTQSVKIILNVFTNINDIKDLHERNDLYTSIFKHTHEIFLGMIHENSNNNTYSLILDISNELLIKEYSLSLEFCDYFYSLLNKQVSKKNNKLTIILDNIKHETFDENHDNISFMKNYLL